MSKDMTGVLFRNDRKGNESQPDRKGSCLIGGKEYWVAGWIKNGKSGEFLSLAFTQKDSEKQPEQRKPAKEDDDDGPPPF